MTTVKFDLLLDDAKALLEAAEVGARRLLTDESAVPIAWLTFQIAVAEREAALTAVAEATA